MVGGLRQEGQEAKEGGSEKEEEEEGEGEWEGEGDPLKGATVRIVRVEGDMASLEENAGLPGFTSEFVHLLLQVVYRDFPYQNDG